MKTSVEEERAEQRRWRLLPGRAAPASVFDQLVENEFAPPETIERATDAFLAQVVRLAADNVPWYGRLFQARRIDPGTVTGRAALARMPILGKREVLEAGDDLRARELPPGERPYGWFSSSGTTGRPARILHTEGSNLMFGYQTQRRLRWFRFDPAGKLATIRLPGQMPVDAQGNALPDGATLHAPRWLYAGTWFETGPHVFFSVLNAVERQLEWLAAERPDYLQSYSETLEHLVFACGGSWPVPGIRKLNAISEQLTPSMRRLVESVTRAPVEQGYGLNEIGLVATRCAADRYHVHVEHCLVEIVDDAGEACAPGRTGRIIVTALRNPAMPLIRYDTGDLAEAVAGPCPCGRTLPAFGEIAGRYSRIAWLPEGTLGRVATLRAALETMPPETARNLRQFQVHQFRDGRYALRLVAAGPLPEAFAARVRREWVAAGGAEGALDIVLVGEIPRAPGGKFQDFTSDFVPLPDTSGSDPI
jgi:phenylacetate-CoA ligase